MSERNRYVRTNLKFMPLEQSSHTRIPSKRLNKSNVYSDTKKTAGEADVSMIYNTNIIKESSMPRHIISRETRPVNVIQKRPAEEEEHVPKANRKAYTYINYI